MTLNVAGKFRCGETDYEAGVQALPGEAAVYYITQYNYNGTPASDIERMARQRELLAALVSRLSQYKQAELFNTDPRKADVLSDVMAGAAPIRMDTSDFGKARLMGKGHDAAASDTKYNAALAEFVHTGVRHPAGEYAVRGAARRDSEKGRGHGVVGAPGADTFPAPGADGPGRSAAGGRFRDQ